MPAEEYMAKHPPGSPGGLLITKLLVAGAAHTQINKALEKEGLATISKQAVFVRRQTPEVQAGIKAAIDDAVQSGALTKRRRLRKYDKLVDRFEALFDARGKELEGEVNGGDTGLLVRTEKMIGAGENARVITEYRVDNGTIKEYRETMKQSAIERGEWTEKKELSGPGGGAIPLTLENALMKVYGDNSTGEDQGCG